MICFGLNRHRAWVAGGILAAVLGAAPAYAAAGPARGAMRTVQVEGADISGNWAVENFVAFARPTEDKRMKTMEGQPVPFQEWSGKLYEDRLQADKNGAAFPYTAARCLPGGLPQMMYTPFQFQITQSPGQVTLLMEEQHLWRQILLKEPHDPDPLPGYHGDSTGRWEGDTLVVDTIGLNDKTTIDFMGLPHTEALHVVERMRLLNPNQLEIIFTFEDPTVFTRPWSLRKTYKRQDGTARLSEYICLDGQLNDVDPVTGHSTFPGAGSVPGGAAAKIAPN